MCRRQAGKAEAQRGDETAPETAPETIEEWYEQRDFDSYFFPLSVFVGRGQEADASSCDRSDDSSASSFPRRCRPGQRHCWDDAEWVDVRVRSHTYLESKCKEPSRGPMLELVDVDLFKSAGGTSAAARDGISRLRARGDDRFLLVLNFRMSSTQLVVTWALPKRSDCMAEPAGLLLDRFLGDGMSDDARNDRLKLLPHLAEGPFLLRSAVPSKPAIVGRQCRTSYHRWGNCLEASVDCVAASFGKTLTKILRGGGCVLSLFAIIEGRAQEELPERLLGAVTLFNADIDLAADA